MSMKNEKPKAKETAPAEPAAPSAPPPPFTLLFHLEDVAVNGRKAAFEVLKPALEDLKIKLTAPLFARYCLNATPAAYLPGMIEALAPHAKTDVEKLAAGVQDKIISQIVADGSRPNAALNKIVETAAGMGIAVAAITALPEGTAQTLMNNLGLAALNVTLVPHKEADRAFPGPNVWLRTSKTVGQRARRCAVLACNVVACKSALSADMRCAVISDEFTGFQDFSGVMLLLSSLDEVPAKEIVTTLFPDAAKATAA